MIDFRAFGGLELRGRDGQALQSVLSQPKRQALLAYLALATPRGFHRRDTLIGLLWPEQDDAHARANLSKAVHYLRTSLGNDVVLSRGQDEIGLDWHRFWCDAAGFEEALDRGEPQEALAIYRGDLLPGFLVEETPEFEEWLSRQRVRLRERAAEAARGVSAESEAAGDLAGAVAWTRRALELAPFDEASVRRLMVLVDAKNGRAEALQAYDDFAKTLNEGMGVEPAPETRLLYEQMRDRATARDVPAYRVAAPAEIRAFESAAPAPEISPGTPPRRLSTRKTVLIAGTAVAVLAAATALTLVRRNQAATATAVIDVAVLPFTVQGAASEPLAGRVVDALRTALDEAPRLRAVAANRVRKVTGSAGPPRDTRNARSYAIELKAPLVVMGRVIVEARNISIQATVHDSTGSNLAVAWASVAGDTSQLAELVAQVAWQITAAQPAPGQPLIFTDVQAATTSGNALEAFQHGAAAAKVGRFAEAVSNFQRAVAADSTFGLAYFHLSLAANWKGDWALTVWASQRAVKFDERLERLDRMRIKGWDDYISGRPVEARRMLRAVLAAAPADVHSWYVLGEIVFHWGPTYGWPVEEAENAFRKLLEYDADNIGALIHVSRAHVGNGNLPAADSTITRVLNTALDDAQRREMQVLRAYAFGTPAEMTRAISGVPLTHSNVLVLLAQIAQVGGFYRPGGETISTMLARSQTDAFDRAYGALVPSYLLAAQGRHSAAFSLLTESRLPRIRVAEYKAAWAVMPFVSMPPAEIASLRDAIARANTEAMGPNYEHLALAGIHPARRDYLVALLSLKLGDQPATDAALGRLDADTAMHELTNAFNRRFARTVRATMLRAEKKTAEALAMLGEPALQIDGLLPSIVSYPLSHERWLRAELLRELGRDAEALKWYGTFPDPNAYDLPYLAPALLRRGELYARQGDQTRARAANARALMVWQQADPQFDSLLAVARGG